MLRDFLQGFIRIHVLHHAAQAPIYGLEMILELARHGYRVGAGTLYPILHDLENRGLLHREDATVSGRIRKYYSATASGRAALAAVRPKIVELVEEVVEGHAVAPKPPPLSRSAGADSDSVGPRKRRKR